MLKRWRFDVLILIILLSPAAFAQEFTGSLNGRVSDPTGAVVPGVAISLSSPAIQGTREAISGESGAYQFLLLPPGTYALKFELPGFKTLIRDGVTVEVQRTTAINVSLEVSTLAETVTVTGESPVVDVQNATVGVNFNQALLRDIPNSRDIWIVLAQTPGINTTRYDVGGSTMGSQTAFRSYGTSGQNWFNLDGVVTTDGPNSAGWYFDYGSFQEIQVSAAANAAEVPVPGAFFNSVVKTGGNALHGQIYLDWEDDTFQAENVTGEMRRTCPSTTSGLCGLFTGDKFVRYNDFNANAGGPIKKDRLWWFFSWRDQYSSLATELKLNNGSPGGHYTTRLRMPTVKFNWQVTPKNTFTFFWQHSRKQAPFRGGQGANASFFIVDSTGNQKDPSDGRKWQWTAVVNPRTTIEAKAAYSGYVFPLYRRVEEVSRRDTNTQTVRGGYSGQGTGTTTNMPFVNKRRHWDWGATLSYFRESLGGNHNFKFGYDVFWEDTRDFMMGTVGHYVLYYNNGAPNQFQTYNSPFTSQNSVVQNAVFAQDKWQIGRKLTLNIGVRFDRYVPYYPAQGNEGIGPYAQKLSLSKTTVAEFNNVVPRFALSYDVFGNGKTAFKASAGRFTWNPSFSLASQANPNNVITRRYRWDGTLPFNPGNVTPQSTSGGTSIGIDPNLKNSHTDEYTLGIDQELFTDFGIRANFVRKIEQDPYGAVNIAQDINSFTPSTFRDVGPDGRANTSDDQTITVYNILRQFQGVSVQRVRSFPGVGSNYSTFEINATKRMSNRWQLMTSADWTKRNLRQDLSLDPNTIVWGAQSNAHYWDWSFKMVGTYLFPRGVNFTTVFNTQRGETHTRRLNVTGLNQGQITINVQPLGSYFYPTPKLWNMRLEKKFKFTEAQSLDAMVDLFNVTNRNTILGVNSLTGTAFNRQVTQVLNPRIIRLGFRYTF